MAPSMTNLDEAEFNKIRDLFKVKLYTIRSEREREREKRETEKRERKKERETLNIY